MTLVRTALLLTISAVLFIAPATPADPAAVQAAAAGWTQAAVKQDAAGLQRFLADDLQYAHAGGQTQNKEQYVAAVTKGPARYESFTFSDVNVKFYGNAAVLTGYVDVKMVGRDNFRVRTLQVYVENGGQWQMAAHQSTMMNR
ncbi:MAG TPA: nuclear transport factor 2 family protein [Bryobacteraceae bacterium]|nr:nuclear transport factor 2 family protein [Bryobacteraceae bacterium]